MIWLIAVAVLAAPIVLLPSDWAGWLILYASFAVVPLLLPLRRRSGVIIAIWGTLVFHHLIALVNVYGQTLYGAAADAANFHEIATEMASTRVFEFVVGSQLYTSILALGYSVAGPSQFFGEETSILAFTLSCVVLVRLMDLLNIERHRIACILLFGLLPSTALFTSITMREAWEILFFMFSVYSLLRFRLYAEPLALIGGVISALLMGGLHNGLIVYALAMVPYALLVSVGVRTSFSLQRILGVGLTALVVASLGAAVFTHSLPNAPALDRLTQGDAVGYAAEYRMHSKQEARAAYGIKLDASSPLAFAASAPVVYIYYMLSPMPWQIRSGLDVYGALNAWLQILLLIFALNAMRSRRTEAPLGIHKLLLSLYFAMSFLWSLGTINYGTAIRHHIVPFWILIVLGVPPLLDRMAESRRPQRKAA